MNEQTAISTIKKIRAVLCGKELLIRQETPSINSEEYGGVIPCVQHFKVEETRVTAMAYNLFNELCVYYWIIVQQGDEYGT